MGKTGSKQQKAVRVKGEKLQVGEVLPLGFHKGGFHMGFHRGFHRDQCQVLSWASSVCIISRRVRLLPPIVY